MQEGDYRPYQPNQGEQPQLPARRGEITQSSLPQEAEHSNEPSHEDMVAAIRRSIAQRRDERERRKLAFDPVAYVGNELAWQEIKRGEGRLEYLEAGPEPYFPKLVIAWDVLSLPFLKDERLKGGRERFLKNFAKYLEPTITLKPNEAKLLDAMAEAAGIPRTHGETEIDLRRHLPEHVARLFRQRPTNDATENP
jgi:hypothetical protein